MRVRSLGRHMYRATIHTEVGGINGLRGLGQRLRSGGCTGEALPGDSTWHAARCGTRMRRLVGMYYKANADRAVGLRQPQRDRDQVVVDLGLVARRGRRSD